MAKLLDTDRMSTVHRTAGVDLATQKVLIAVLSGTEQEKDLSVPVNCEGVGRIRRFRRHHSAAWLSNPLPIEPVAKALGLGILTSMRAQVFQNAICNWRCWYCYVPFPLLSASRQHSRWLSAAELVELYLKEPDPAPVIDLSGGQPDLVPEWIVWMMEELIRRGLERTVYLWSDDNLSNDYFWKFLSERQRETIATYPFYSRVCCFKGFNRDSFSFNTMAAPELFDQQFDLMKRLIGTGMDVYGYVTLTARSASGLAGEIRGFVDRLQEVNENLPLRMVPLEIQPFTPVVGRLNEERRQAVGIQAEAVALWSAEMDARFSDGLRSLNVTDVAFR